VGLGLEVLALGDEPVGEADGVPVAGSAAISRPKVGGRIALGAGDERGLAREGVGACISATGDGEGAWLAADAIKEGDESANSPTPLAAWE
jgi:hypothetical protein